MGTLSKIFNARKQILAGVINLAIRDEFVETVHEYRMAICKKCKYHGGKCSVKGTGPCCGACGCSLAVKTRSLDTVCGLSEINKTPLWYPVVGKELAQKLEDVTE